MGLHRSELAPGILDVLFDGTVIPAHPLALDASRDLDRRRQRAPGSNQVAKLLAVVRRYISVIQSSRTLLFGIAIALAVVVALTLLLAGPLGLGRGDVYVAVVGPMTGDSLKANLKYDSGA